MIRVIYFYDAKGYFRTRQAVRGNIESIINWANRQCNTNNYMRFDIKKELVSVPDSWIANV